MKKITFIFLLAFQCAVAQQKPDLISISNHPLATNITRKVEPIGYTHFWSESLIKVHVMVYHYKNDTLVNISGLGSYEEILHTSFNVNRMVDNDGVTLLENNGVFTRPDGLALKGTPVKQYDYFNALILGGSVNIPQLIRAVILQEDQVFKRFNR